jgi:hypothetical protein
MLAVMPKQPSTPKRRRGRPSTPSALILPITVKINGAIWKALEQVNPDVRIALRLIAVQRLIDMKLLRVEDLPPVMGDVKHGPKGRGAK